MIGSPYDREAEEYTSETGAIALASALDVSDEAVYIYDAQGRCQWVNRSGEQLLRMDARDIIGRYIFELFPGDTRFQIRAWRKVIDAKAPSSFLSRAEINGNSQKFQTSIFPVMDYSGKVRSVVSIGRRFADRVALQYENQMQGAELALVHEIASIMSSRLDIEQVYERFAAEFNKLVEFDRMSIMELDASREKLKRSFVTSKKDFGDDWREPIPLKGTALEWILQHGTTHFQHDLWQRREFEIDEQLAAKGVRSIIRVPLATRNGIFGVLALSSFRPFAFDERARVIAERVAAQIAPAIENARFYHESQAYAGELEVIDEIAIIMTSNLHIDEVHERFATEVKRLVEFDRMSIILADEESQKAVRTYSVGLDTQLLQSHSEWPLEGTDIQWVVEHGESVIENDLSESGEHPFAIDRPAFQAGFKSGIKVPLVNKDDVIGAFALWSLKPRCYGAREQRILERLAAQIAPAIENAKLYEEVEQTLETLRSTQEQLVKVERLRAMGELASGVAHDFNNALAAILGQTQLMITHHPSQSQRRSLELIEQAAHDSAHVVRRILDFARFQADADFSAVDVNQLISDVVELTRHKWHNYAHSKGLSITVRTHPADVPKALGNYADLREVLMNMVINSCEAFESDGFIDISTGGAQENVIISIADTGMGMTPEVKQKIFEPFFTSKGESGTGLGLSVAFGIISHHNGTIEVDTEPGRGTIMRILLPIAPEADELEESPATTLPVSTRRARILVIEDEPLIRETLADMLAIGSHEVTVCEEGERAIEIFAEGGYDLVFTDLGMPGLNGWDVATLIKEIRPDCPVVLVTGWGAAIDQKQMEEHRVDEVLPKPFDIDVVLNLVQRLTDRKE